MFYILIIYFFSFLSYFGDSGVCTQCLMLARQMLYHLSEVPRLFYFF
jgi:hypothetical protein